MSTINQKEIINDPIEDNNIFEDIWDFFCDVAESNRKKRLR